MVEIRGTIQKHLTGPIQFQTPNKYEMQRATYSVYSR